MYKALAIAVVLGSILGGVVSTLSVFDSTRADSPYHHGNVDCSIDDEAGDVLHFLQAVAGRGGVAADCSNPIWVWPTCENPGPTECDTPVDYYPTTAPGEPIPPRLDLDCDGDRDSLDVLVLLKDIGRIDPVPCLTPDPSITATEPAPTTDISTPTPPF